jgi:hypothetical protein
VNDGIETPDDVAALASMVGLHIAAEHAPGVMRYLQLAAGMAALVMDFPLAVDDEPAEVFRPAEVPR